MADIMKARLQTPVDDEGHREDIHLVTDVDAVIYDDATTLKEYLDRMYNLIDGVSNRVANVGTMYLATSGSESTDTSMMLFAEVINAGAMDNVDVAHTGVNNASKDVVDYVYETASSEDIQDLTREQMIARGWKEIVTMASLIDQGKSFDPLTMINIEDMIAYNNNVRGLWTQGTIVRKVPKTSSATEPSADPEP